MVLGAYQAAVECRGTFGPRQSCASILDDMEATAKLETFGLTRDPAVNFTLPVVLKASMLLLSYTLHLSESYS